MIEVLEANRIPTNNFKGEIFCSRFGINIDSQVDPQGNRSILDVIEKIDGTRSTVQIANECGVPFDSVQHTLEELHHHRLIGFIRPE